MSSIDERVVKMRLENGQFEQGVSKTASLLDKLKKSLNLDKSVKSMNEVDQAVGKINFDPLAKGLESTQSGFTAMGAVAFSVLNRITNMAIDAGKSIANSLTASVREGFAEYETQMGSIQTILSNTRSKGTNLDQVNRALNTLNTYADKTIYNFTEMTRNIGTFTAAGVDLQTSVDSIKGLANLAAASGSSSAQAAQAMYQLSQALAAGKIQLMDWNSVVNAGMGGELFQNALKRTAENMGKDVDGLIAKYGSFRESLTQGGWLTADVMTETLKQISGAYSEADLLAQGYTQDQAKEIVALAKDAEDAATKVKTFTQLIDTTKEALGSGWTNTWQIIIGDFEESKDLWTGISNQINDIVNASSNARNQLLSSGLSSGWKQILDEGIADTAGFQEIMTQTARDHGVAIDDMIEKNGSFTKSMSEGWVTADIVSESVQRMADRMNSMSEEELHAAGMTSENVDQINKLNESLQNGSLSAEDFADKMNRMSGRENIIAGLTNVFRDLGKIFEQIGKAYREVFPAMTGDELYSLTERFKEFTKTLTPSEKTLTNIGKIAKGVFSVFDIGAQAIKGLGDAIATALGSKGMGDLLSNILEIGGRLGDWLSGLDQSIRKFGIFEGASKTLGNTMSGLLGVVGSLSGGLVSFGSNVGSIASKVGDVLGGAFKKLKEIIKDVGSWILDNVSFGDVITGLVGGSVFSTVKKLGKLFDTINGVIDGLFGKNNILKKGTGVFSEVLGSLTGALNAFAGSVKVVRLIAIAAAVSMLVSSIEKIGKMGIDKILAGVVAIGALMLELNRGFKSLAKTLKNFSAKGVVKTSVALIAFAKAVSILAEALVTIGQLNWDQIAKGLTGMGGAMAELVLAAKGLNKAKVSVKTAASLVIMAQAVKMVADPLKSLGDMSWESIGRGLTAMGGALAEMATVSALLGRFGKGKISSSVGILIMAQSLGDIADAFGKFSQYNWGEVGRGLTAMGGALAEVGVVTGALGKLAGFSGIIGSTSILIAAQSLGDIADAFGKFAQYDWGSIGRGLAAMGGALSEVGLITGALGKLAGISGVIGGGAIVIAAQGLSDIADAFGKFAQYDWGEIGRGLVAMGGAMGEVGLVTGALGKLAGFSGILGGEAIKIAAQGLDDIAKAFGKFTQYDWGEIGRGLVAMGGAMGEVGVISGATGALTGIAGLMGAGTITLASQGLIDLATAFGKFAEFDWDEIGRGLTAMGAAMGETALGSLLNTFSGFGAGAISTIAKPLGVLADSVKKWQDVKVPEGLADQLGKLADGIMSFTFAGWGGNTVANIAKPMDTLAVALGKWSTLSFPTDIGTQLTQLSDGVKSFTLAFAGGWSLGAVVGPFGDLAGAVKKWKDVVIPDGIQAGLTHLANGVKAFSLAFAGGWSLMNINGPFGDLAGAVKKWKDVTVPDGIQNGLTRLANGVKAFSFAFMGGLSLNAVIGPLGKLAGAVSKWGGISLPQNLGYSLKSLADGVTGFANVGEGVGPAMTSVSKGIGNLASSASTIANVNLPAIGSSISSFLSSLNGSSASVSAISGQFSALASQLGASMASLAATTSSNVSAITAAFLSLKNGISSSIAGTGSIVSNNLQQAANAVVSGSNGISAGSSMIVAAFLSLNTRTTAALNQFTTVVRNQLNQSLNAIRSMESSFKSAGTSLTESLVDGMKSGSRAIPGAFSSVMQSATSNLRGYRGDFESAGSYVAAGFVQGIKSNVTAAANQAASMAKAAADAAKAQLDIHSPSKVFAWIGEMAAAGLENSLNGSTASVGRAGSNMAKAAVTGFGSVDLSFIDGYSPSIRPVIDLSSIRKDTALMSSMLDSSIDPIRAKVDLIGSLDGQNGADSIASVISDLKASTDRNTTEIANLRSDMSAYQQAIADREISVNVDGKKLASAIVKPMNQQLGIRSRRGSLSRS